MKRIVLILALLCCWLKLAMGVVPPFTSLTLAWLKAPSHGTNISYVLKWGDVPGSTNFTMSVGTNLTALVTNLTSGFLYFHVVARTTDGLESDPSNVVITTNHPAAPLQLRISTNTTTSLKLEGSLNGTVWIPLANITNDPVVVQMRQRMILRTVLPPLPGGAP